MSKAAGQLVEAYGLISERGSLLTRGCRLVG